MSYLTALLPVEQGVAYLAALRQAADTARNGSPPGDQPRTRGQVMADTLVERLTGQTHATDVNIEVHLVMTDTTLLTDDHTPAHVISYGPLHAAFARDIVHDAPRAWLRRLYTHPTTGDLITTDSHRRPFTGKLRNLLIIRDQTCRTPWCDAPIRHADHITPAAHDGHTSTTNGQGLCEACNYTKQAPGWQTTPLPSDRHQVLITTPTGHTHLSSAPDPQDGSASHPTTKPATSCTSTQRRALWKKSFSCCWHEWPRPSQRVTRPTVTQMHISHRDGRNRPPWCPVFNPIEGT